MTASRDTWLVVDAELVEESLFPGDVAVDGTDRDFLAFDRRILGQRTVLREATVDVERLLRSAGQLLAAVHAARRPAATTQAPLTRNAGWAAGIYSRDFGSNSASEAVCQLAPYCDVSVDAGRVWSRCFRRLVTWRADIVSGEFGQHSVVIDATGAVVALRRSGREGAGPRVVDFDLSLWPRVLRSGMRWTDLHGLLWHGYAEANLGHQLVRPEDIQVYYAIRHLLWVVRMRSAGVVDDTRLGGSVDLWAGVLRYLTESVS